VFFPIAFFISKRSWDKNKEKNELDIKPMTGNSSHDKNSMEESNDTKDFNFTMDEQMKKTIEDKMQPKRVYLAPNYESRISQQLSLHDCNAEAPLEDQEQERFAVYHSLYTQSDADPDKAEDIADFENLPIPPTSIESPHGDSKSLIYGQDTADGAASPGRTVITTRRDSELASSRSGRSRKASSFFTFGAVDKMERLSSDMVCLDDDYCSSSTSLASNSTTAIESNSTTFQVQISPASSNRNGESNVKTGNFYTFGSVDRMEKPESFDIADFYPGSESFDNEFASSALGSMIGMHGGKDSNRGMRYSSLQNPAIQGVAIDFNRDNEDDNDTLLGSDERMSFAELPRSISHSHRRFSSSDGQFTRISTEREDGVGGVTVDAWQQSRIASVATDRSADLALHMSSSPHSVKFKAIKNKFETMIQQNHTKQISLTPTAKSTQPSRGVALNEHRRSRSDGNIRRSDLMVPDVA